MELFKVATVEETKAIITDNFNTNTLQIEEISLDLCLGRVLAYDVVSDINVPGFFRSTVDGYAVKSADVAGASETIPSILEVKGEVVMGREPQDKLDFPGACMSIPTGGMLPGGADSVVMIEYTDKLDENTVICMRPSAVGENVVAPDEDISTGETVLKAGTILRPYEVGVLSSLGFSKVSCYKKIMVGIISTGDEIVDTATIPKLGQVRDINTYLLHSLVLESGNEPVIYGVAQDEYQDLKTMVEKAYSECDIVLISGGSSVGKKDQSLKVMESLPDAKVLIHGIAIKPGKPTIVTKAGRKAVFGLPGHPLACAVVFKVIVRFYMELLTGYPRAEYPVSCVLTCNYHKSPGREEYLPVALDYKNGEIFATPIYSKAGLISGFSKAWGFVKIDRDIEGLKAGDKVKAYQL